MGPGLNDINTLNLLSFFAIQQINETLNRIWYFKFYKHKQNIRSIYFIKKI